MSRKEPIHFYFDLASPYAYLASESIDALGEDVGREVIWKPFVLGAVFKATGNDMPARIKAKAAWMTKDLAMHARVLDVPFRFPRAFPIRSIALMRALLGAEERGGQRALRKLAHAMYRVYWGEGIDVSSEEGLRLAAERAGMDADQLVADNDRPELKARLAELTQEAIDAGAFGAPTMIVGDQLFWGNDRLALMRAVL